MYLCFYWIQSFTGQKKPRFNSCDPEDGLLVNVIFMEGLVIFITEEILVYFGNIIWCTNFSVINNVRRSKTLVILT